MKEKFEPGGESAREQKEPKERTAEEWVEDFRSFYKDLLGEEVKLSELEIPVAKEEAARKLGVESRGVRAVVIPKGLRLESILEGAKHIVDVIDVEGYERSELEKLGNRDAENPLMGDMYDDYEEIEPGTELVWVQNHVGPEDGVMEENRRRRVVEWEEQEEGELVPEYGEYFGNRTFPEQLEGIGRFITLREEVINRLKLVKENPDNIESDRGTKCSGSIDREGEGSEDHIYSIPQVSTFKDDKGRIHLSISKAVYTPYGYHLAFGNGTEGDEESKWPSRVVAG